MPIHGFEAPIWAYATPGALTGLIGSNVDGRFVAVPLDDPGLVGGLSERDQGEPRLVATAIVGTVGDPVHFRSARQLTA